MPLLPLRRHPPQRGGQGAFHRRHPPQRGGQGI